MSSGKVVAVLVDLSGTLHVGDVATAGAVEALKRWDIRKDYHILLNDCLYDKKIIYTFDPLP